MEVANFEQCLSLKARGKTGYGAGFGWYFFGYSFYGSFDPFAGIYATRHTARGRRTFRLPIYRPTNPQTVTQQANRARLSTAVLAWQSLTILEKKKYNKRAKGLKFSGYNYFLRLQLNS